jgi:hypothetical protein
VAGAVDDEPGSGDQDEQVRRRLHPPTPGPGPRSQARKQKDERPHRGGEHQEGCQAAREARGGEAEDRDRGQEGYGSNATDGHKARPEEVAAKPGRRRSVSSQSRLPAVTRAPPSGSRPMRPVRCRSAITIRTAPAPTWTPRPGATRIWTSMPAG